MKTNKPYVFSVLQVPEDLRARVLQEWSAQHSDDWFNIDTSREKFAKALKDTRTYHLRIPDVPKESRTSTSSTKDILACRDTALFQNFPSVRSLIDWAAFSSVGAPWGTLGRVFITRLSADSCIGRHTDEGLYFSSLHRHHFVLSDSVSMFHWEGYSHSFSRGDLCLVNNSIPHWVENRGPDRTHLIFDAA